VRKTIAPPPRRAAGQKYKLVGSGAKNSFGVWGKRKFFAPSPSARIFFTTII